MLQEASTVAGQATEELSYIDKLNDISSFEFAFTVSILLICFVSILKYYFANGSFLKELGHLILELPIDICAVLITLIVSVYLAVNLGLGIALLIGMIIFVMISCGLRRWSIKYNGESDKKSFIKSFVLGTIEVILTALVIIGCYRILSVQFK